MKKRHGALLLFIAILVFLAGSLLLVMNRNQAASMAKAIVASDAAGKDVQTDVLKLKAYAAGHMKVNVHYELKGSYDRAVAQAKADAAKANGQGAAYAAAQQSCDKKGVDSMRQAKCVSAYLAANGGTAVVQPVLPDEAAFKMSAIGPAWNLSIPGVLLAAGLILGLGAIISIFISAFSSRE